MSNSYQPYKHLTSWQATNNKTGVTTTVTHYPFQYRLLELSKLYPNANFSTEVLKIVEEADFILIRVSLFVGTDYETSTKKTQALKQGRLSQSDKVESGAKLRCLADFGLGTPHAIESKPTSRKERLNSLYTRAKALNLMELPSSESFLSLIREVLDIQSVEEKDLTSDKLDTIEAFLDGMEY